MPQVKFRYKALIAFLLIGLTYLAGIHSRRPKPIAGPLPKDDIVRITVDPDKHHLRIEQPNKKPVDTFLPDRPSTFEVKTNGTVTISSSQWGLEHHIFVGMFAAEFFRFGGGLDFFYFKKLDVGIGAAVNTGLDKPVVMGKISYCVYDNIAVGVTYDSAQRIGGAVTIRL